MYTKLSRWLIAAALLGVPSLATAQDPVRLPEVIIKAPMEKPGARALVGVARDTFATPIDGVEITISELKRRALTNGDGTFRFDQIGEGEYRVRARKIGYAPQLRTIKVERDGGVGAFELLQLRRALPPVVVTAVGGGIGGLVGDTSYKAIVGAEVRLLEHGVTAKTDSSGFFHFNVEAGQYYLTVKRDGYVPRTLAVRVPKDSGRRVTIFLEAGERGIRSAHNMDDLAGRLAARDNFKSSLYSRDDMIDMGIVWVGDVIQGAVTRVAETPVRPMDTGCVGILNGGPETVMLRDLTIDDVATIEVYPTASTVETMTRPPSRLTGKKGVADSHAAGAIANYFLNTERASQQNAARSCALVYVWMR